MNGAVRGVTRGGFIERAVGLPSAFKEWATAETGATAIGAVAGVFIGEMIGSWLVDFTKVEDKMTRLAVKAIGKAGLSFVLYFIGRKFGAAGGMLRVFMNGASIGSLASLGGDVIEEFFAPALGGFAGANIKGIQIKASHVSPGNSSPGIGSRTKVITSV